MHPACVVRWIVAAVENTFVGGDPYRGDAILAAKNAPR